MLELVTAAVYQPLVLTTSPMSTVRLPSPFNLPIKVYRVSLKSSRNLVTIILSSQACRHPAEREKWSSAEQSVRCQFESGVAATRHCRLAESRASAADTSPRRREAIMTYRHPRLPDLRKVSHPHRRLLHRETNVTPPAQ